MSGSSQMKFEIVTIFPDFFRGPLDYGIVRRAREAGLIEVAVHDLRAHTHDRHKTVDDRPFGGGEGMVLKPEPLFECVESLHLAPREQRLAGEAKETVVLLSPQGRMFTQAVAEEMAALERIVLICGRYEGVDERVAESLADQEISIGDYVLSGGEIPAMVLIDAVARLVPGVVGDPGSLAQDTFADDMTGWPQFTRPADYRGMTVPDVLLSGDHARITQWRRQQAAQRRVSPRKLRS